MIHRYPRARILAWYATDLLLLGIFAWQLIARAPGRLTPLLAYAAAFVVLWNVVTLHYPRAIEVDDRGIAFSGYGRAHRYEWSAVERVHVRKFLVRDRVLVRITPSPPWRGRYWVLSAIEGYDKLIATLPRAEARGTEGRSSPSGFT